MLYDRSFTPGECRPPFAHTGGGLFGPVQTLARVNDMVQRASAAAKRIFEVLDAPDELARCS
jgi:ABC-type multidrug transport system fused ATPase/permease subunit